MPRSRSEGSSDMWCNGIGTLRCLQILMKVPIVIPFSTDLETVELQNWVMRSRVINLLRI